MPNIIKIKYSAETANPADNTSRERLTDGGTF